MKDIKEFINEASIPYDKFDLFDGGDSARLTLVRELLNAYVNGKIKNISPDNVHSEDTLLNLAKDMLKEIDNVEL